MIVKVTQILLQLSFAQTSPELEYTLKELRNSTETQVYLSLKLLSSRKKLTWSIKLIVYFFNMSIFCTNNTAKLKDFKNPCKITKMGFLSHTNRSSLFHCMTESIEPLGRPIRVRTIRTSWFCLILPFTNFIKMAAILIVWAENLQYQLLVFR